MYIGSCKVIDGQTVRDRQTDQQAGRQAVLMRQIVPWSLQEKPKTDKKSYKHREILWMPLKGLHSLFNPLNGLTHFFGLLKSKFNRFPDGFSKFRLQIWILHQTLYIACWKRMETSSLVQTRQKQFQFLLVNPFMGLEGISEDYFIRKYKGNHQTT